MMRKIVENEEYPTEELNRAKEFTDIVITKYFSKIVLV